MVPAVFLLRIALPTTTEREKTIIILQLHIWYQVMPKNRFGRVIKYCRYCHGWSLSFDPCWEYCTYLDNIMEVVVIS